MEREELAFSFRRRIFEHVSHLPEDQKKLLKENIDGVFNSVQDISPFEELMSRKDGPSLDSMFGCLTDAFHSLVPNYETKFGNLQQVNELLENPYPEVTMHIFVQSSHTNDDGKVMTDSVECSNKLPSDLSLACNESQGQKNTKKDSEQKSTESVETPIEPMMEMFPFHSLFSSFFQQDELFPQIMMTDSDESQGKENTKDGSEQKSTENVETPIEPMEMFPLDSLFSSFFKQDDTELAPPQMRMNHMPENDDMSTFLPSVQWFDFSPVQSFFSEIIEPEMQQQQFIIFDNQNGYHDISNLNPEVFIFNGVEPPQKQINNKNFDQSAQLYTFTQDGTESKDMQSMDTKIVQAYNIETTILCILLMVVFLFGYLNCLKSKPRAEESETDNVDKSLDEEEASYLPLDSGTSMVDTEEIIDEKLIKVLGGSFPQVLQEKLLPVTDADLDSLCEVITPGRNFSLQVINAEEAI